MLGLILTPISINLSSNLSIFVFGNLNSGIPYLNTPPICACASNIVTSYPLNVSMNAIVIPAGPPPIIATFDFLVSVLCILKSKLSMYFDEISFSISPNLTPYVFLFSTHIPSHCFSCGQTNEHTIDNGLFLNKISPALNNLLFKYICIISLTFVSTGQPFSQNGILQFKHLKAS